MPKLAASRARVSVMKPGTRPCGSPTAKLTGGLPGSTLPKSAASWAKGPGGSALISVSDKVTSKTVKQ